MSNKIIIKTKKVVIKSGEDFLSNLSDILSAGLMYECDSENQAEFSFETFAFPDDIVQDVELSPSVAAAPAIEPADVVKLTQGGLYIGKKSGVVVFFPSDDLPTIGIVVGLSNDAEPTPVGTLKTSWKPFTDEESWEKLTDDVVVSLSN